MKALCVLTTILGIETASERLVEALDNVEDLDPTYVLVTKDDYVRYRAPRWARLTNPWEVRFVAKRKAEPFVCEPFDALIVNCWELAVAFQDIAARLPSCVALDATPVTVQNQLRQQGARGLRRAVANRVHHRAFARAARVYSIFLAKSSLCAASLQRDYGVAPERCFLTLSPQRTDLWKPSVRHAPFPPVRLLFVGNDFTRKGGDLLLRLYAEHLAVRCTLTIASNDPGLATRQLPPGVELLRGQTRDQLLPVFQSSHLFVFPTLQDYTPEVVSEALAAGLPCIAGEVDGMRDLIRDGENGFVMPRGSSVEQWAARVNSLVSDASEIDRMSRNARRFAEEQLSFERYEKLIRGVVDLIRQPRPLPAASADRRKSGKNA